MKHLTISDEQRNELRQGARAGAGRVSERMHFVLLSGEGHSVPAIGQLLGYDAATVRTWLTAYEGQGIAGLEDEERSGRPAKEKNLVAIAQAQTSQSPRCFGYVQACWTIAFLTTHLRRCFGVKVSVATLRRAVHGAGFRWGRPRLAPAHKADPRAEEKLVVLQAALADPQGTILAQDECDLHLLPVLRAMWQRIGEQVRIPTPGQNAKRAIFGACDLRTGRWFYQLTQHKRSVEFIAFLTILLTAYPTGIVYVMVDNATIHSSRLVLAWLQAHPRLHLVYLPTYSGHHLNPVEKVWWALKDDIAANRCFKSLAELDTAIRRHFSDLSAPALLARIQCDVVRQALDAIPQMS